METCQSFERGPGLGEVKYLAGIKWSGAEGNSVEVGYQTCVYDDLECELVYEQLGVRYSLRVPPKRIRGFVLITDKRGIRALSVVLDNGQVTEMIGEWYVDDGCLVSWRMAGSEPTDIVGAMCGGYVSTTGLSHLVSMKIC